MQKPQNPLHLNPSGPQGVRGLPPDSPLQFIEPWSWALSEVVFKGLRGRVGTGACWSAPSEDSGPACSPRFRPASLLPLRGGTENKAPIARRCHCNASFCALPPSPPPRFSRICPRPCSWHFLPLLLTAGTSRKDGLFSSRRAAQRRVPARAREGVESRKPPPPRRWKTH